MDPIAALLYHNGQWDGNDTYSNFDATGILIPGDCNFSTFVNMLEQQLKIQREHETVVVKYKPREGHPLLKIENDFNLKFFMEIKRKEPDWMKYPLCIDVVVNRDNFFQSRSRDTSLQQLNNIAAPTSSAGPVETTLEQSGTNEETRGISTDTSTVSNGSQKLIDFLDYANIVCKNVVEKTTSIQNDETSHNKIEVGGVFEDKDALIKHISEYALKNHFQYRVKKSCNKEYRIHCIDENCSWFLRASINSGTGKFTIRKFDNTHTCSVDHRMNGNRQATSRIVGELLRLKYLNNIKTVYTPADIMRDMKDEYGISIEYKKAWRSKNIALERIRGRADESYQKLPSYLFMLKETNPGSMVEIETKEDNTFLFLFMALKASIEGWKHCRPIVVVDSTFLKASYGGTLLSACTEDAYGHIFPLAFAVVDSESDKSWVWFFGRIREIFGVREGMCIVSDMHVSIEAAVTKVYPEAAHRLCMYHLLNNLKKNFKKNNTHLREPFIGAAKAYTNEEFEKHMSVLDRLNNKIRPYLSTIGYNKWTRLHCPCKKYFAVTSNIAESLNAVNVAGRDLPVTTLLEYIRSLIQDWTCKNRDEARSTSTNMTTTAESYLERNYVSSLTVRVKRSNDHVFSVNEAEKVFTVDLGTRTCTCNMFQIDVIPCPHAIAVLKELNQDPYQYCSYYYKTDTMIATYSETIYPIGHEDTWTVPSDIRNKLVLPPEGKAKSGKPRKRRYKAA